VRRARRTRLHFFKDYTVYSSDYTALNFNFTLGSYASTLEN
jgi:hypothetical protein